MENPLISFIISSYNQEAYIREAVEGALCQTYSPLEIIISDDCSEDRTFDIVQQMVADYKGRHIIRINRNQKNLGIGGNHNQAIKLCQGELIVGAGGDDISLPERTSSIVQAWNESERKAHILYSRCVVIDGHGNLVDEATDAGLPKGPARIIHQQGNISGFLRRRRPHVTGCAYATSRKLTSLFGPMPEKVTYEDTALCFRGVLAGGLFTFIDAPLVKYRRHGKNVTFGLHQVRPQNVAAFEDVQRKRVVELDRFIEVYKCFAADAERALKQNLISTDEYPMVRNHIIRESRRIELKRDILIKGWKSRWAIFCRLYSGTIRPRELLTQLPHLLPRRLYRWGLIMQNRIRHQKPKCFTLSPE